MPLVIHSGLSYGIAAFDAINEAFTAHGEWTRVEDVVNGTQVATVWRSPTSPTSPSFHICMYRPNAATTTSNLISFFLFEGWNPTTKSFSRPAPAVAAADVAPPAADGSYGGGAEYPLLQSSSFNPLLFRPALAAVSVSMVVAVTRRGVVVNTYAPPGVSTATYFTTYWLGVADSIATVNDPVPIGIFDRPNNASTSGRWTRYPTVVSPQAGNWGSTTTRWSRTGGVLNGAQDRLWGGILGSRVIVGNSALASQASSHGGWQRGFLPDVLEFDLGADPVLPGDTLVVGTDAYEVVAIDTLRANAWAYRRAAA